VLFDFADIESYDSAGTCHPDETAVREWCVTGCANHACAGGGDNQQEQCVHLRSFDGGQKGRALRWRTARLAGGQRIGRRTSEDMNANVFRG
jgi:hypothetical protein